MGSSTSVHNQFEFSTQSYDEGLNPTAGYDIAGRL